MTTSVLIPVYNGSRTIEATVESVLRQTRPADEILVMDDGSTDETYAMLQAHAPRVTLFHQPNRGVAAARNALCAVAKGEVVSFLDSDDLWHCRYLELIEKLHRAHPQAVGFFAGHVNFVGYGGYEWKEDPLEAHYEVQSIPALGFLRRYNADTGSFGSPSFCSVPRWVLQKIGPEPFKLDGVEDSYLCTTLPLFGGVVYASASAAAYRITEGSMSADRLKMFDIWVDLFRRLQPRYAAEAPHFLGVFNREYASRARQYGKTLMSAGRVEEGRRLFREALHTSHAPVSVGKSLGWLWASYLPRALQPKWPPVRRQWKPSEEEANLAS